jgi:hypothetical protein
MGSRVQKPVRCARQVRSFGSGAHRQVPGSSSTKPEAPGVLAIADAQSAERRWAETWQRVWPGEAVIGDCRPLPLKLWLEHGVEGDLMYDTFPDAEYSDR